jgi:hypothetical protein
MRKVFILLPLLLVVGCAEKTVYIPESYKVKNQHAYHEKKDAMEAEIVTAGKKEQHYNFKAPMDEVFNAAVRSVAFLQWPIAFTNEEEGMIRLQEAYVYSKNGKIYRSYTYPSSADTRHSDINYYLERVAQYTPGTAATIFSQENLKITLEKVSDNTTDMKIDYSIRPYTLGGPIGYEVLSNGYIESIIIDNMKDILVGKPVASNR